MFHRWIVSVQFWIARLIHWRRWNAQYIVMLGAPGAGKGTQAAQLAPVLGVPHLSTGDVFRSEIAARTDLGLEVERYVSSGGLVPDEVTFRVLRRELEKPKYHKGAVLDGFPRTLNQAKLLSELLAGWGNKLDRVVLLDVPEKDLIERLSRRGRADDVPEVISERLSKFRRESQALLDYYKAQSLLSVVQSTNAKSKQETFAEVLAAVNG